MSGDDVHGRPVVARAPQAPPRHGQVVLGIDGGGSKTTALLANRQGQVLGRGTSGPSNYQVVGSDAAWQALDAAI